MSEQPSLVESSRPDGRVVDETRALAEHHDYGAVYTDGEYDLEETLDVLADRFDDALGFVQGIHEPWTREPDATIYLDVDPETAAERSGATNKFETVAALEPVRENYERLIADDPDRFVRIDATQSQATVQAAVEDAIAALLD